MSRTFVIAEAGSTHGGEFDRMRELVWLAKLAGADAFKTQWTSDGEALARRRHLTGNPYALLEWPDGWHKCLRDECLLANIEYLCTVYLPEDIAVIAPYVTRFKIASFEATDMEFIKAHEPYGKPVIISTGMMSLGETLDVAVELTHIPYALLHCVSAYPAPIAEANLAAIRQLTSAISGQIGLSDHTRHPLTGALAVALGAEVIEAHVRLTTTDPSNPDYPHSFGLEGFCEYVRNIRTAEVMLGSGEKRCQPSERENVKYRVRA